VNVEDSLKGVTRLYLDTAPVIYYIEKNPEYYDRAAQFFRRIDDESVIPVSSPVTLAECLVHPLQKGDFVLADDFTEVLVDGSVFVELDAVIARQAAELRSRYGLALDDSFQVAAAIEEGCDAVLTNDQDLKRVTEVRILVLSELTA
jgi:predicted nucleic acid-binding protein